MDKEEKMLVTLFLLSYYNTKTHAKSRFPDTYNLYLPILCDTYWPLFESSICIAVAKSIFNNMFAIKLALLDEELLQTYTICAQFVPLLAF